MEVDLRQILSDAARRRGTKWIPSRITQTKHSMHDINRGNTVSALGRLCRKEDTPLRPAHGLLTDKGDRSELRLLALWERTLRKEAAPRTTGKRPCICRLAAFTPRLRPPPTEARSLHFISCRNVIASCFCSSALRVCRREKPVKRLFVDCASFFYISARGTRRW